MRPYVLTFLALLALLAATVAASFADLGSFNILVALLIALAKAALVLVWFMHLRKSGHLIWLWSGAGFAWLLIALLLTAADYLTRALVTLPPH